MATAIWHMESVGFSENVPKRRFQRRFFCAIDCYFAVVVLAFFALVVVLAVFLAGVVFFTVVFLAVVPLDTEEGCFFFVCWAFFVAGAFAAILLEVLAVEAVVFFAVTVFWAVLCFAVICFVAVFWVGVAVLVALFLVDRFAVAVAAFPVFPVASVEAYIDAFFPYPAFINAEISCERTLLVGAPSNTPISRTLSCLDVAIML